MTLEIKASEENIAWPTTHGFRIPKPSIVPLAYIISVAINSGHQDTPHLCHLHQWSSRMSLFLVVLTLSFSVTQLSPKSTKGSEAVCKRSATCTSADLSRWTKKWVFQKHGDRWKKKKNPRKNQTRTQQTNSMLLPARLHLPLSEVTMVDKLHNSTSTFCRSL